MIAYLSGRVQHRGSKYLVLRTGDVGYKVYTTPMILNHASSGATLELHIHEEVGEDIRDLYGFATLPELEFFELLLSVSGVGPKSALSLLSLGTADELKKAILDGNTTLLTKASGIGKKGAQRIIIDLRSKLDAGADDDLPRDEDPDAIDGLIRLGYKPREAREALIGVDPTLPPDEKIKTALKNLGKR